MEPLTRSLSSQESKVVLALTERGRREATRGEIIDLLGGSVKAADNVIESLRRKGWLERATWGEYLLVPPEQGPDALGDSNLLALASRIADYAKADVPPPARERLLQLAARSRKTHLGTDPARARPVEGAIGYDKTWRLFVNVKPEELQGSAGLGRRKVVRKDS